MSSATMTPAELLADAKRQQHLLLTGQAAKVFVDQNGERVEYNNASLPRLAAYIATLEEQVNAANCPTGPMRVWM
jgi:hypothetical protein